MKLVIAEKPSVARDLSRVLKATSKKDGYFEGNGYQISWAIGHLVQLIDPDGYDDVYKNWTMEHLPIIPETFKTCVIDSSGAQNQYAILKGLLTHDQVSTVICATDAGREGELIFRHIYALSGCQAPIQRLWISSQTDQAIKEGFESLQPGEDYQPLYDSALCRSEADWLVGMNATRAYTINYSYGSGVMSVGRVQTPVLKMIVDRYHDHVNFTPETFYEISTTVCHPNGEFEVKWVNKDKETRFSLKADADLVLADINSHASGTIHGLTQKQKTEKQPLLYDLTELQKDANRRFKFSAEKTLKLMQSLYETHKVVTYPRTSSRYLTADMVPKLKGLVTSLSDNPQYQSIAADILSQDLVITNRIVDDKKVTDHHAIIPTEKPADVSRFSADEAAIYDLVMRRFLAVFLPECLKDQTEILVDIATHHFRASGTVITRSGWRMVYADSSESLKSSKKRPSKSVEDIVLPIVKKGDGITHKKPKQLKSQTKAPALYNEASILAAMETAGKDIDDEALREAMKDCGLGTPATRAQILERLIAVGYITREKNRLSPTEKGIYLISSIKDPELLSPELTGNWEKKLNDMAKSTYQRAAYMTEIESFTKRLIANMKADRVSLGECPLCQGGIQETKLSFGCSNWKDRDCKFTIWKSIAGKVISSNMVQALLQTGETDVIEGFKSKAGKSFDAALVLKEGSVEFKFSQAVLGKCQLCDGDIIETQKAYSCSKWRETQCGFVVWKEMASRTITKAELALLLTNGQTDLLTGFKSKAGKPFDAVIALVDGKAKFQFNS